MLRRFIALASVSALASISACVACASPLAARHHPFALTLDWTPNPDHVGFYYALDNGLFTLPEEEQPQEPEETSSSA